MSLSLHPPVTLDRREKQREALRERRAFSTAHRAEKRYAVHLRAIAKHVEHLTRHWDPEEPSSTSWVIAALRRYAEALWPWARATSQRMLADVTRRDEAAWARFGRTMGRELHKEIASAPTGDLMRALLDEQVGLITSLPRDAAQRVHEWTLRGIEGAERPSTVAEAIYATGHVTRSRATLIARTEVARTSSKLVEARARHVGSEGYIWRTAGDADVRREHRLLNGRYFTWDDPPIAGSNGSRAHAGTIYNCRCVPEPVLPELVG